MKKIFMILTIFCLLPILANSEDRFNWGLNWDSGVYYSLINNQIGFGTTISIFNYSHLISLNAGILSFKDFNPVYIAGLGLNLKTLIEKIGGNMEYSLPFQMELGLWAGKDMTIDKWHYGLNCNFIKVKF